MAARDDEEERLRSVALQNARSILVARRRAEEALQKQWEWLRVTLSSIGDAVITTDGEGRITFLNRVAEDLTCWPRDEAEGRPLPDVFRIVDERTRRPVEDPALRALREGTAVALANHTVLVARDGSERPIDDSAAPMKDEGGATLGTVLVFRDVTERRRAEEARARLAAIVESSEDAIVGKTLDGIIRSWNAGAQRIFGYTPEEAVGRSITLIIPPERQDEERAILERLRRGERVEHFETVRVAKDGRRLDISLTISPVRDDEGRIIGASKIARDITGRKRAEAAVRERDERLQLFLGNATDYAVVITDPEGHVLEWIGGAERITGWLAEEVLGESTSILFTAEDRAAGVSQAELARAAETGRVEDKRWHVRKDGTRFFGDGVTVSLRGPAGELRGFGKVFRNATEQKRAEEALLEADRRKDEFLALLAHELRNPLAPLRNGLQVIRMAAGDATAVDDAREMMERQLGHMVRLIDDLLDVSRSSRKKMELRRARVLLADVIRDAEDGARPAIEVGGHDLTVSLPDDPVLLDADLTRLAQVFSNLLTNSAKYTEPGGRIWLTAERRGGQAIVSVRDTGIGIPSESLGTIFDMFSQVDRSLERSTGGLGIGLALVKGLVEMHGGTVTAASAGEGMGSTFTVTLPVLEAPRRPASITPSQEDQISAGSGRRILVVDDNRDSAMSMAMMLGLMGDEVRTARDGVEALEVAEAFRPQVILMDVGMPRLNGYDATRLIRGRPWGQSVTIIALTGWGQEDDRRKSDEAGCNGHLVKPVSLPELQKLLTDLADGGLRRHARQGD
jgi:PAS domain S-box-containing protein